MLAGNFPEWQLCIQTMDPEQEASLDFDPLDSTKIWPEVRPLVTPPGRDQTLPAAPEQLSAAPL